MFQRIPDNFNILAINTSNKEDLKALSKMGKSEQEVMMRESPWRCTSQLGYRS